MRTDLQQFLAGLVVVAAVLLAGCTSTGPVNNGPVNSTGTDPAGTSWVLSSMRDAGGNLVHVPTQPPVTLEFRDEAALGGSGGCNLYGGSYERDGSWITIGQLYSTLMYCEGDGVSERESLYFGLLGNVRMYRIEGDSLRFFDGGGSGVLVFTRALPVASLPLAGTPWVLKSLASGKDAVISVMAGTRIDAVFTGNGSVSGSAGCNQYFASYTSAGSSLTLGPVGSTKKFCGEPEGIMGQEQSFLSLLSRAGGYRIEGDQLKLVDPEGNGLLWFGAGTGS
ncbi:MAG: META domain-containing protein [Methanomicrobiales archaeon]|nr:META domain-containing protein [Methanomicrobiales archaeon]